MPNWCENRLTIEGTEQDVRNFIRKGLKLRSLPKKVDKIVEILSDNVNKDGTDVKLSLTSYLPMPKTFSKYDTTNQSKDFPKVAKMQKKKYGCVGWYNWGLKYLGTKWDADFLFVSLIAKKDGNWELIFDIDTAWTPPVEWLENVQEKFISLNFLLTYEEPGCGFKGVAETIRYGEEVYIVNDSEDYTEEDCEEYAEEDYKPEEETKN